VGAGGAKALDAANILKPALARGEPVLLGNIRRISKYFEKIRLERRLKIMVEEPDTESAISILRGIKENTKHIIKSKSRTIIIAVSITTVYNQSFSTRLLI
jgi:ATP-dependent Clp protease ATP-binding subunit ClpB